MSNYHTSVLLREVITYLRVTKQAKYIDATLGGGGHAAEIVKKGGIVLGIDVDTDAVVYSKEKVQGSLQVVQGNFGLLDTIAKDYKFEQVRGIIFDLGVSSHQLDEGERGFSFLSDAPLDMRMDTSLSVTAADLVNGLTKGELLELFKKFGDEPHAYAISSAIERARKNKLIQTTKELADIAVKSYPKGMKVIHPATRIFQALRIAVNDELNNIKSALPKAVKLLESSGRLVVISFHSLEDRIVKHSFKEYEEAGLGTIITDKPIVPGDEEIWRNRRARSAKMRVFEKI